MLGIRFCGCGCLPVRGPLCLFWREPPTKSVHVRLPTKPEEDEGRAVPERAEETNQQNRVVSRREQSIEVEGSRLLGPVDPEARLANVRGWVSVLCVFVGISLEYTLAIAHRCTESYAKVSETSLFLHLELTQVRVCLFSFLPPPVVYVVCF